MEEDYNYTEWKQLGSRLMKSATVMILSLKEKAWRKISVDVVYCTGNRLI